MEHRHWRPPLMKCTKGWMYARQRPQRCTPASPKFTSGSWPAPGSSAMGWRCTASGMPDFDAATLVLGSALVVSFMKREWHCCDSSSTGARPEVPVGYAEPPPYAALPPPAADAGP